jgi:hypothetical protein
MTTCQECERLRGEVQDAIARLIHLNTALLNAFRAGDHATFMNIDKELENAMGSKERTIGAMRQHEREHAKSA